MRQLCAFAGATVALIFARLAVRVPAFSVLAPSIAGLGTVPSESIDPDPRALGVGRAICRGAERLPRYIGGREPPDHTPIAATRIGRTT